MISTPKMVSLSLVGEGWEPVYRTESTTRTTTTNGVSSTTTTTKQVWVGNLFTHAVLMKKNVRFSKPPKVTGSNVARIPKPNFGTTTSYYCGACSGSWAMMGVKPCSL